MKKSLPIVAIVGRPNVGKSSLFNYMLKERKSIVDEMEGVTRDINVGQVETPRGVKFHIYDTAGYLEKGDRFNKLVQEKVKQAIAYADVVLFMVDGRDFHPIDRELALFLKRQDKPAIVLVNKLDNPKQEESAYEFYTLGFEEIIPCSVIHKLGMTTLLERLEDEFENIKTDSDNAEEISVALVGKPNVGKSMLTNTFLGYERSIVSDVPGTTRDAIDDIIKYQGKTIRLVDTAGMRRKANIDEDIEYYSNVRTIQALERADVVIQLIDASEPISHQDKRIADTVLEKGRALIIVFNKWDLIEGTDDAKLNYELMNQYRKEVLKQLPAYAFVPVEFISAKDAYKIPRLLDKAIEICANFRHRVSTSDLNNWLTTEIKESNLERPSSNLNIYYATQVSSEPPYFVLFINSKKHLRKDFKRYVINKLRLAFDFTGVPVWVSFREKEKRNKK